MSNQLESEECYDFKQTIDECHKTDVTILGWICTEKKPDIHTQYE